MHLRFLGASALIIAATAPLTPAFANCYHKIPGVGCKSGYVSGYKSDCITPCSTGLRAKTKKHHAVVRKTTKVTTTKK